MKARDRFVRGLVLGATLLLGASLAGCDLVLGLDDLKDGPPPDGSMMSVAPDADSGATDEAADGGAPANDGSTPDRDGGDTSVAEDSGNEATTSDDSGGDTSSTIPPPPDAGLTLGAACVGDAGGGCASGFCVDGVCCETDCSGQCEACNLPDAGGTCTQVNGAPVGGRPACGGAGTPCVGTCAEGAMLGCTYPGAATACGAPSCANGVETPAAACNGQGGCTVPQTVMCTNPAACAADGGACANACTTDSQCPATTPYCNSGACESTKEDGLACAGGSECSNGNCVDGVCCNSPCSGLCEACDVDGDVGSCVPVPAGGQPHGGNKACAGAGAGVCGGSCQPTSDPESLLQCAYPTGSCGSAQCSGATFTPAGTCASGACVAGVSEACSGNLVCNAAGVACDTSCATDGDCTSAYYCAPDGQCAAQGAAGSSCTEARDCAAGTTCVDGVCCTSACTTACYACNVPGHAGTCTEAVGASCGAAGEACNASASCVTIYPPQQIAPLSTALTTSQTPVFKWVLGENATGARVQICAQRSCETVLTTFAATGTSGAPSTALGAGVYFWRAYGMLGSAVGTTATPVWEFRVGKLNAPVNTSWGTIVDPNGDGYADLLVGQSAVASANVYVYLSAGTAGIASNATPNATLAGLSGASAGDVNGDGFADVVVGAPGAASGAGSVIVYQGGPSGISTTPLTTIAPPSGVANFGYAVASAGDVNGDGYADIVVGAEPTFVKLKGYSGGGIFVFLGGSNGVATSPVTTVTLSGTDFGEFVAGAGDVNGDGYGDVIAGATGSTTAAGQAWIYLGGQAVSGQPGKLALATTGTALTGVSASAAFGGSVAGMDDENGDGYADVVVGNGSGVCVFFGDNAAAPQTVTVSAATGSVAGAGDVNGDGYADFVFGASESDEAFVYYGGSTTSFPSTTLADPAAAAGNSFGNAVAGVGDVNGDGYADLGVCDYDGSGGSEGYAYIFQGGAGVPGGSEGQGLKTTPSTTLSQANNGTYFGTSLE